MPLLSVAVSDDGVAVSCLRNGEPLELQARWLLDASGRDTVIGKQLKLPKIDLKMPRKFAPFAHFHGVKREAPPANGHIVIVRLDFGWFWMIPRAPRLDYSLKTSNPKNGRVEETYAPPGFQ